MGNWIQQNWPVVVVTLAIPYAVFIARGILLLLIRVGVDLTFRYVVSRRSKILEGEPPGEGRPLWNYLNGHKYGTVNTLNGIVRKWVAETPYNQLVVAEGLGLALSIRRFLHFGPLARDQFERMLPPTVSIGRGSFEALVRGIRQPVPKALIENTYNGWDAFLRLESYFFILIMLHFVKGRDDANRRFLERLHEIAASDPPRGWALAFGFGRGAYFVTHTAADLTNMINSLGPELAPFACMGSGVPLINTISDDVTRFGKNLRDHSPSQIPDVLAGVATFLAFSGYFWGPEWLEEFKGLTPENEKWLRQLESDAGQLVRAQSPLRDLAATRHLFDDVRAMITPELVKEIIEKSTGTAQQSVR